MFVNKSSCLSVNLSLTILIIFAYLDPVISAVTHKLMLDNLNPEVYVFSATR